MDAATGGEDDLDRTIRMLQSRVPIFKGRIDDHEKLFVWFMESFRAGGGSFVEK